MRALVIGIVGAGLVVSAAVADTCKPGHMSLTSGSKKLIVANISQSQINSGGIRGERTVFRVTIKGKPYILDMQKAQGSSAFLNSYAGIKPDSGGMPVRWGSHPAPWWHSSGIIAVEDGPLKGEWRIACF